MTKRMENSVDLREVFLPYCMQRQPDGRYALLNRRYKPVGFFTGGWVQYDGHPVLVRVHVTPKMAASVSWEESPEVDQIYFYDDGCIPTASAQAMDAYLMRIARIMTWKIEDDLPRADVDLRANRELGGSRSKPSNTSTKQAHGNSEDLSKVTHMSGTTWWQDYGSSTIAGAIVTEQRIAFDVMYNGFPYAVVLIPSSSGSAWWSATWTCKTDRTSGDGTVRLYRSTDRGIALIGGWMEEGERFEWFTELGTDEGA